MHLKRLLTPKFWRIERKKFTWAIAPSPGPHNKKECIPLVVILRDILKIADTAKEGKTIINKGNVLVDGKIRRDYRFPVGLFDTITIPKLNKSWRIVPCKNGLKLIEIPKEEANKKVVKINNISVVKGGKFQLNLNDGKNILVKEKKYSTGDSLLIELPSMKILEHLPLKKGSLIIGTKGRMSGMIGKVLDITKPKFKMPSKIVADVNGKKVEVMKEHAIVIGKDNPVIKL